MRGVLQSVKPALFFEKVQLAFFQVGLLAQLFPPIAEHAGQAGHGLLFPSGHRGRVNGEHLRDLRGRPLRPDGLHGHLGLQARRVILVGVGHWSLPIFHAGPPSKKGPFFCPNNWVHYSTFADKKSGTPVGAPPPGDVCPCLYLLNAERPANVA